MHCNLFYNVGSNCRIPCHSKLYPLKSGYVATQLAHALSSFLFLEREIDTTRLRGYATTATRLRGELDLCVACLFRPID